MTPEERLAVAEDRISELRLDCLDHARRISAVERFQQWFVGAAAVVGFVFGLFSDAIKSRLGLS